MAEGYEDAAGNEGPGNSNACGENDEKTNGSKDI